MLGLQLKEISAHLHLKSLARTGKSIPVPENEALEVVTAWFLRLWFLNQLNPDYLDQAWAKSQEEDCPYTFFQIIRIVIERGIHEPSDRQRELASSLIHNICFTCPRLESTDWWEQTLSSDSRNYMLPKPELVQLIDCAKSSRAQDVQAHFPQVTKQQFQSDQTLVTGDLNAIRAKLYLCATQENYSANLLHTVKFDPLLSLHNSILPPEDQYREYKATFRFDTKSGQKNPNQQLACMKAVCGFLNAEGGTLVIGVDDDLTVIGLEGDFSLLKSENPEDAFLQIFHEAIKQSISPIPLGLVKATIQPYGEHLILIADIKASPGPFLLKIKGEYPAHFVRDGNRTLRTRG